MGAKISFRDGTEFDLSDPFYEEREISVDFRMLDVRSRVAPRLCFEDPERLFMRLEALGRCARVRAIADAFGWSKPTVVKFLRDGLLRRKRGRPGAFVRNLVLIEVSSAVRLAGACYRIFGRRAPEPVGNAPRIRARIAAEGPCGDFSALPLRISVRELAEFLRCTPITVLRMVRSGVLDAHRRTPFRWEFHKKDLPSWVRLEK